MKEIELQEIRYKYLVNNKIKTKYKINDNLLTDIKFDKSGNILRETFYDSITGKVYKTLDYINGILTEEVCYDSNNTYWKKKYKNNNLIEHEINTEKEIMITKWNEQQEIIYSNSIQKEIQTENYKFCVIS